MRSARFDRLKSRVAYFLWLAACVVTVRLLWDFTGFGGWVVATPAANAIYRSIGVLLFGGFALLFFLGSRSDPTFKTWPYRLAVAFFLLGAIANAAVLFSGATNPSDLVFPE